MFVRVENDKIVNLAMVNYIKLDKIQNGGEDQYKYPYLYEWEFHSCNGVFYSDFFKTKEDAMRWFEENIKPYLKDYNNIEK